MSYFLNLTHSTNLFFSRQQIYRTLYVRMPADDMSELFVWVDEQDRELGAITREVAHNGSRKIHRSVTILIFNSDKSKILFQQRSSTKDLNPEMWGVGVGGHVTFGDSNEVAVKRELCEELGIVVDDVIHLGEELYDLNCEQEYIHMYETIIPEATRLTPDPDEVMGTEWCDTTMLSDFIASHQVCPYTVNLLVQTGYLASGV